MSTTAGYIDETRLLAIRVLADSLGAADRINKQFQHRADILKAVMGLTSAQILEFSRRGKVETVQLEWMNACADLITEFSNCGQSCNKASTNIQERTLTKEVNACFDVSEDDWRDNDFGFDQAVAKLMVAADKQIIDQYAQYVIAFLNLCGGVNTLGTEGKGVVVGNLTYIDPAYWDPSIMAYMIRVAAHNQFTDPTLLDGSNMIEQYILAKQRTANADGKGDSNLMSMMPYFADEYNMALINANKRTYMVQKGSIAFANIAWYEKFTEGAPKKEGHFTRFSRPNIFLPELKQDIFIKSTCNESAGDKGFSYNFQALATAQMYLNPEGCDQDNTGVLIFECGTV